MYVRAGLKGGEGLAFCGVVLFLLYCAVLCCAVLCTMDISHSGVGWCVR